jgi:hypothetical protein
LLVTPPQTNDEVWFYGGYEHTFAMPYELMVKSPLLAAIEKPHGYATFASSGGTPTGSSGPTAPRRP